MNLWQRKLLAYLHDPPGKPFNIAEHREMADAGPQRGLQSWDVVNFLAQTRNR